VDSAQQNRAIGVAQGRREAAEHFARALRTVVARWRAEEAGAGALRAALLHSLTERWCSRVEALALELEQQLPALRAAEAQAIAACPPGSRWWRRW